MHGSSRRAFQRSGATGDSLDASWWKNVLQGHEIVPTRVFGDVSAIDLFCGSGGLSLGAKIGAASLGLKLHHEFAADFDPVALGIYQANHTPRIARPESVASFVSYQLASRDGKSTFSNTPKIVDASLHALTGHIDLLLAGPPCQGHSTANNKTRFNDPRNLLYLSVPALAIGLEIPAVIIENVPGVLVSRETVVQTTIDLFQDNGYTVTTGVLKSDALGWPQKRNRFFLVATRDWEPVPLEIVSSALRSPTRPISWALNDLLDTDEQSIMTEGPLLSAENQRRVDFLHDEQIYDLPNSERPECHRNGTTYRSVYGRLNWDEPSPTITTGFSTPGRGRYVHPLRRRTLLPREAARLQGFPDTYRFEHTSGPVGRTAIAKGIGDAVPSILGFAATLSALANRPIP